LSVGRAAITKIIAHAVVSHPASSGLVLRSQLLQKSRHSASAEAVDAHQRGVIARRAIWS
jgi:hypothetical protein